MPDVLQQAMQSFATQNTITADITIFCAEYLVYVLVVAWLIVIVVKYRTITLNALIRTVLLAGISFVLSLVLTQIIIDPRPYLVEHLNHTLVPVSTDNGFPSDHTLLAAFLATSLWWLRRRFIPYFAAGTLLVALARLGIAAHHTLDVAGSIVIVLVVALVLGAIPLPKAWDKPLLGGTKQRPAQVARR